MARRDEGGRRGNPDNEGFEGRDLLIGRPDPAEASGEADAGRGTKPPRAPSPTAGADDRHRENLARFAAIETQLKSLMESGREADRALAREVAALGKGEEKPRSVLAAVVELAEEREADATAAARVLDEGVARLTEQGEAQQRRLDKASQQAEARRGAPVVMNEPLMRKFGVGAKRMPTLELRDGAGHAARLEPHALWIIGENDRVDLKCDGRFHYIIDTAENFARPNWEVSRAERRCDRERVTREWLRRVLQ